MKYTIAVIHGDGIGPEVVQEAIQVLDVIAEKYQHTFTYTPVFGGFVCHISAILAFFQPVIYIHIVSDGVSHCV